MICKGKTRDKRFPYSAHKCNYHEWKDGYCKLHHPEEVKRKRKERYAAKDKLYKENTYWL